MPNVFLILCGLVIMAMVGLWLGIVKTLLEMGGNDDSTPNLECAAVRSRAGDGDAVGAIRDGGGPELVVFAPYESHKNPGQAINGDVQILQ